MAENKNRFKLNNEGSALVTVLIVALFISILATTILYLASRNFIMKQTDRKTKESFYETEATVEEIKAHVEVLASNAYKEAYSKTLSEYASVDTSARAQTFFNSFVGSMANQYAADLVTSPSEPLDYYQKLMDANEVVIVYPASLDSTEAVSSGKRAVYLRGVKVSKTNDEGYTSIISTDLIIEIPDIYLGVDQHTAVDEAVTPFDGNTADLVQYINWVRE